MTTTQQTVTCRECARAATVILPVVNWACPSCGLIQPVARWIFDRDMMGHQILRRV